MEEHRKSQLPFGSVPFRHILTVPEAGDPDYEGLNYLSAQCPFGTLEGREEGGGGCSHVSITFRLSALSAL